MEIKWKLLLSCQLEMPSDICLGQGNLEKAKYANHGTWIFKLPNAFNAHIEIHTHWYTHWTEYMKGLRVKEMQCPHYIVSWRSEKVFGAGARGENSFSINTFYGEFCDFVIYGRTRRMDFGNLQINSKQTSSLTPNTNTVSPFLEYTQYNCSCIQTHLCACFLLSVHASWSLPIQPQIHFDSSL